MRWTEPIYQRLDLHLLNNTGDFVPVSINNREENKFVMLGNNNTSKLNNKQQQLMHKFKDFTYRKWRIGNLSF